MGHGEAGPRDRVNPEPKLYLVLISPSNASSIFIASEVIFRMHPLNPNLI